MPGLFRCDRGDYARVLHLISHARLRVHWASGIPCALVFLEGRCSDKNSDASRREIAELYLKRWLDCQTSQTRNHVPGPAFVNLSRSCVDLRLKSGISHE